MFNLGWHSIRAIANHGRWMDVLILVVALWLRLQALELKPAHFDEGVNGFFVDYMTQHGFYHYDPTNFHGPLHFYILFAAERLFGRELWVLRLPLALASAACVGLLLFGFRRFVSANASRVAALAMAASPGFVFYGRYAIHETWLVLFTMLTVMGGVGIWKTGSRRDLWMAGIGVAGMILTKETWIIHVIAFGLAMGVVRLYEMLVPSAPFPPATPHWEPDAPYKVGAVCLGLIFFFYSGCLVDPSGLAGFGEAFVRWIATGTDGSGGHNKPWWYWLQLLGLYEWPVLLGLVASMMVVSVRRAGIDRFIRWLAIAAGGTLAAYSIIGYKTPWCLIAWAWPFFLLFGHAVEWMAGRVDRWVVYGAALLVIAGSAAKSVDLNFHRYADENEPYVYVQTTLDIYRLLDPLKWEAEKDPSTIFNPGHLMLRRDDHYPMRWLLGQRPNATWNSDEDTPDPIDADWLLVDEAQGERVEGLLSEAYFRETIRIRGMEDRRSLLYFRASSFSEYFKDRTPEFVPGESAIKIDPNAEGAELPIQQDEEAEGQ